METLGWDINPVFVYVGNRDSLASPWVGGGRGRTMPLRIPPLLSVRVLVGTELKGILKTFAEASPELRNMPKASAASDRVLITLAHRIHQFIAKDLRIKYEPTFLVRAQYPVT